jgi:hypothetical protein
MFQMGKGLSSTVWQISWQRYLAEVIDRQTISFSATRNNQLYCFKQYHFDGLPKAPQEISASRCFTVTSDINHRTRNDGMTTELIL